MCQNTLCRCCVRARLSCAVVFAHMAQVSAVGVCNIGVDNRLATIMSSLINVLRRLSRPRYITDNRDIPRSHFVKNRILKQRTMERGRRLTPAHAGDINFAGVRASMGALRTEMNHYYLRRTHRDLADLLVYRALTLPRPFTKAAIADGLAMSDVDRTFYATWSADCNGQLHEPLVMVATIDGVVYPSYSPGMR